MVQQLALNQLVRGSNHLRPTTHRLFRLSNILQNTSKDANMQISVEKTGDLERRMVVQVPEENIEGKISSRLDELRRQVRLKGFRPGRVPLTIIRSRYGKQVREEIMQERSEERRVGKEHGARGTREK